MTLKELIMQVSFDELLPCLKEREAENDKDFYLFREAYDRLRNMEPDLGYKGTVRVEWCGDEEDRWISVSNMHDADWEQCLSKEIAVAEDVHLRLEELAMYCLWEITFYGFSPEEQSKTFDRMLGRVKPQNRYEIALDRLEESIWKHQNPRRLRSRGPHGIRLIALEFPLKWGDNRMNRSKRKREYRQERRREYLKRMSRRLELVESLAIPESSFNRSDVEFMLTVDYGREWNFHAVTHGHEGRLAYIAESMAKYQKLDLDMYNHAIVCVHYPSLYPLETAEIREFEDFIRSHLKYKEIRLGTIVMPDDNREVEVQLLLSKLKA